MKLSYSAKTTPNPRRLLVICSIIFFSLTFLILTALVSSTLILRIAPILAMVILFLVMFKIPETVFVLFLFAGEFKANPIFERISDFIDITVIFALLTVVQILWVIIIKKQTINFDKSFLLAWYWLCCLMMASLLWTPSTDYGWPKAFRFVTLSSLSLIAPIVLIASDLQLRRLIYATSGFCAIYSSIAVVIGINTASDWGFVSLPGSNYLSLGNIAGIGAIIAMLYLIPRKGWSTLAGLMISTVSIGALLLSGGRGPLISFAFSLLLIVLVSLFDPMRFARATVVFFILLTLVFAGIVQSNMLPYTLSYRLSLLLPTTSSSWVTALESAGTGRPERWRAAFEALSSHPLQGLGSGGFANWFWNEDIRDYPHNIFLEVGAELGFPGLLLVIYLCWSALRTFLSSSSNDDRRELRLLRTTTLGIMLFSWIGALFSGDFNDNRLAWMSLGLLIASGTWQSAQKANTPLENRIHKALPERAQIL